jgi:hypothetical protein
MPTPVKAQPLPFGIGRGVEYGGTSAVKEAVLLSFIGTILENLLRNVTPEYRAEATAWMNEVKPGWIWGSPMQHGLMSHKDWLKYTKAIRNIDRRERYPRGVAEGGLHKLDKGQEPTLEKAYQWLCYLGGERNFDTMTGRTEEHAVPVSKHERIIEMLIDMAGHDDINCAPPEVREVIQNLTDESAMKIRLMKSTRWAWLPYECHPEQWEAREYHKECLRYQASEAGRKAKKLLLENLSEQQTEDYFNKGYFFVVPPQKDKPIEKRRIYVVERSYPNGNIMRVRQKTNKGGRRLWYPVENFCYHTEEPHAVDDILLAQKMMIENDEEEFRKIANISSPWYSGRAPLEVVKRSF